MEVDLFTPLQLEALRKSTALASDNNTPKIVSAFAWLDSLPVKVVIGDADGKAYYWNKQWYEYTGLPLDYPKNKMWKAALHPDDIQRTYNGMSYSVRTGQELQIEYRLRRASDEQYRWHLARAYPLKNDDGQIVNWLVAVTDIHDQKAAEQQKDMFLSIAAHEIKTPITTLKTLLHVYKNEVIADNDGCPNVLEQAESQLLRIERLVSNLLDVSRMNAHKMVYRFEEFNFGVLVKECVERMQQQSARHTIILEQNANLLFTGDRLRLEQVMNNLLSNAIKYSPDTETIIVKSYVVQDELYFSVQDFGIGITPENIEHIYTAYYRAANTAATSHGLGIGLYICSEIIKNHLGKIWVQSALGEGSTFYVKFPINKQLICAYDL